MTKFFKTKLKTTKTIDKELKSMAGTYRRIFNIGSEKQWNYLHFSKGLPSQYITGTELRDMLIADRRKLFPYVKKMDGGILTAAAFKSNESFKNWWKEYNWKSPRRPRFLSRKKDNMSFKTYGKLRVFYDHIEVPKLGKIKLYEKGYIPQGKTYSNITFSHDGNDWWISLEVREKEVNPSNESCGEIAFLNVSAKGDITFNGKLLENPIFNENYLKAERRRKKLSKKLKRQSLANIEYSRRGGKTRTSRNMIKTKKLLSKVLIKMDSIRKDSYKKQCSGIAKTKLKTIHYVDFFNHQVKGLEAILIKKEKKFLAFLNMIKKRVAVEGIELREHVPSPYTLP